MAIWLDVLSETFVNISAAWFAVAIIEPQINLIRTQKDILALMFKLFLGIISLVIAKYFREKSQKQL